MSEWIEWEGGECPVKKAALVEIEQKNGYRHKCFPGNFFWNNDGDECDIARYRIIGEQHDAVNAPSHYALLPGVEVIDVRDALFAKMPVDVTHDVADCWSRSWEYLTRMWGKNGLEDAKKAKFYLDRMIEKMERTE